MNLYDTIASHVNAMKNQMFTSLPAVVLKVYEIDGGGTVVDCSLGVRYMTKDGLITEDAPLMGIPLVWPSAAGCYITFPIEAGDTVMVNFAMRDVSRWVNGDGSVTDPFTRRLHNLSDAFAMPSMLPYGKAPKVDSEAVKIASTGTEIRILKDGTIELGEGATEAIIKGNAFKTYLDSVITSLISHTHPVSGATADVSPALAGLTPMPESTLSEVSKTK